MRIHRKTVQKDLHDADNHDGVITHLEPDILECEVKWALGSISTSKASGGDGIPVELFQILDDEVEPHRKVFWAGTRKPPFYFDFAAYQQDCDHTAFFSGPLCAHQ